MEVEARDIEDLQQKQHPDPAQRPGMRLRPVEDSSTRRVRWKKAGKLRTSFGKALSDR